MKKSKFSGANGQPDDAFEAIRCDSVLLAAIRKHSGQCATLHARRQHGQFFGKAFVSIAECELINGGNLFKEAWSAVERRIDAGKIVDAAHMAKSWLSILKRNVKRDQGRAKNQPPQIPPILNNTDIPLDEIPLHPMHAAPRLVSLSSTWDPVDSAPTPIKAAMNQELADLLDWEHIRYLPTCVKVAWAFAHYLCDESKRHGADTYIAQFAILDEDDQVVDLQQPGVAPPSFKNPSDMIVRQIRELRVEGLIQLRSLLTRRGYSPDV